MFGIVSKLNTENIDRKNRLSADMKIELEKVLVCLKKQNIAKTEYIKTERDLITMAEEANLSGESLNDRLGEDMNIWCKDVAAEIPVTGMFEHFGVGIQTLCAVLAVEAFVRPVKINGTSFAEVTVGVLLFMSIYVFAVTLINTYIGSKFKPSVLTTGINFGVTILAASISIELGKSVKTTVLLTMNFYVYILILIGVAVVVQIMLVKIS